MCPVGGAGGAAAVRRSSLWKGAELKPVCEMVCSV